MKLLIANRGEIALRIIRTCRKLGIKTVLVYSQPDQGSLPLQFADERYPLNGSMPAETYLNFKKIIGAAKATQCDAIHPGYGFLSENASFVEGCVEQNIIFIGPSAHALQKLGNKLLARETMHEVGVPLIPGSERPAANEEEALAIATETSFPLIIKAVYGGGGRGMRVAHNVDELRRYYRITKLESASAFGRDEVYIEKRLIDPRHVEIQAIGDRKGSVITLGERECSIQRRHQKLLEEAPSIGVSDELRRRMVEAAKRGLGAAGYTNAGTVEFLVDKSGGFYFLEVNKRLQVEHLVTELTTGLDIVEEQLNVAMNGTISVSQSEIKVTGWAINCRINAEDPRKDFAPSPGNVIHYQPPSGPGIRMDSALCSGSVVPEFYDSMIAKLAAYGRDRHEAIQRMTNALDETEIIGVPTTIPLHRFLMRDGGFRKGEFHTTYLDHVLPRLASNLLTLERIAACVAASASMGTPASSKAMHLSPRSAWRGHARTSLMERDVRRGS